MVSVATAFLLTAGLFGPGSAGAAGAAAVVAPPNATTVGFVSRALAIPRGETLDLVGADTTAHNVACVKKVKKRKSRRPMCQSPFAASGQVVRVKGVEKLKPGTYALICQLHPQMTLALTVLDTP